MSAPASDAALWALAEAAGLARQWTDASGRAMTVANENLQAILKALTLPCDTDDECRASQARLMAYQREGRLPPLVTALRDRPVSLPLPLALAGRSCRIELEQGGTIDTRIGPDGNGGLGIGAIADCGYHRLRIGDLACTLAVAPARCFGVTDALHDPAADLSAGAATRCWGIGVQLYSLRREGDGGIGDFSALDALTRRAAEAGAATVAISPVHAMFSADTYRYSPYGPSSRLFLNALYIDPAAVAGPDALAIAMASLDQASRDAFARLEQESYVDWPLAGRLRLTLLRALFDMSHGELDHASPAQAAFAEFRHRGGQLVEDHARFETIHALQTASGAPGDWRLWPIALRDARSPEVAALAASHSTEVDFHAFLQWQAARGLAGAQARARHAGMSIGLIADLAIGADRGGSQAWSRHAEMINGLSVGAPPDIMNTRGQDWGLGAFSPHAMHEHGFQAYIEMLRAVFAHCGGVRIDHVLGLARLWLVPDGATSAEGAYLRYPMEDMLRLIALESHRHRAIVIGEDLGTVPAGFDTRLAEAGLLGIRVLYFETGYDGYKPPRSWSREAIATTTTHDLPTVAGWWSGIDIEWRARLDLLAIGESSEQAHAQRHHERGQLWQAFRREGICSGEMPPPHAAATVVDAALAYVAATPAPLVMIPIEDLLGLIEQPNLPGTVDTHPNWRRRLPSASDALFDAAEMRQRLASLHQRVIHPPSNQPT
jgi:4-alpha-glucanotransferase